MIFKNFGDLNSDIAFAVIDNLKVDGLRAAFGKSGVSESAYVNISFDDEDRNDLKLRFAGHDDRHGADITFRTDEIATVIYSWSAVGEPTLFDDDGEPVEWQIIERSGPEDSKGDDAEFSHVEIEAGEFANIVAEAVAMVRSSLASKAD